MTLKWPLVIWAVFLAGSALAAIPYTDVLGPPVTSPNYGNFYPCGLAGTKYLFQQTLDGVTEVWVHTLTTGISSTARLAAEPSFTQGSAFTTLKNGKVLFINKNGSLRELWSTDCTTTKKLLTSYGDMIQLVPILNDTQVIFTGNNYTGLLVSYTNVYYTDGDNIQTGVSGISNDPLAITGILGSSPVEVVECFGDVFVKYPTGLFAATFLYRITPTNFTRVNITYPSSDPEPERYFCHENRYLFFAMSDGEYYRFDNTSAVKVLNAKTPLNGISISEFEAISYKNEAYFFLGAQLWKYREANNSFVLALNIPNALYYTYLSVHAYPVIIGSDLYFLSYQYTAAFFVIRYNGATAKVISSPIGTGSSSAYSYWGTPIFPAKQVVNNVIAYVLGSYNNSAAWIGIKDNDTAIPFIHDSMLESFDCIPAEQKPTRIMDYGGFIIVKTYTKKDGTVLHKIDGSSSVLQYDEFPGPDSAYTGVQTEVGGGVAFTFWTTMYGTEPYWTDGTPANTMLLKDIMPGCQSSNPDLSNAKILPSTGELGFVANSRQLWATGGTPASTRAVADTSVTANDAGTTYGGFAKFAACNNFLYFDCRAVSNAYSVCRTDLTDGGTVALTPSLGSVSPTIHCIDGQHGIVFGYNNTASRYQHWYADGNTLVETYPWDVAIPDYGSLYTYTIFNGGILGFVDIPAEGVISRLFWDNGHHAVQIAHHNNSISDDVGIWAINNTHAVVMMSNVQYNDQVPTFYIFDRYTLQPIPFLNYTTIQQSQVVVHNNAMYVSYQQYIVKTQLTLETTFMYKPVNNSSPRFFKWLPNGDFLGVSGGSLWLSEGEAVHDNELVIAVDDIFTATQINNIRPLSTAASTNMLIFHEYLSGDYVSLKSFNMPCTSVAECGPRTDRSCDFTCSSVSHTCITTLDCTTLSSQRCNVAQGICEAGSPAAPAWVPVANPLFGSVTPVAPGEVPFVDPLVIPPPPTDAPVAPINSPKTSPRASSASSNALSAALVASAVAVMLLL